MDRLGMSRKGASQNVSGWAPSGNQLPTFACHSVPVPYTFVTPADESKAIPATGITMARATLNHQDMASSLVQVELNQAPPRDFTRASTPSGRMTRAETESPGAGGSGSTRGADDGFPLASRLPWTPPPLPRRPYRPAHAAAPALPQATSQPT